MKKPGTVNRTTPKDSKVFEFKFQIMLRLELCWVTFKLAVALHNGKIIQHCVFSMKIKQKGRPFVNRRRRRYAARDC